MIIYKILSRRNIGGNFIEYVVQDNPTDPSSVLRENGYESGMHVAKVVSPQHVIDHYKELNDEQELVFDVVEKILRSHENESHA